MLPASQSFQPIPTGLSDITDAERQLARELDGLLAKRPLAPSGRTSTTPFNLPPSLTVMPTGSEALSEDKEAADFDWIGLADAPPDRSAEPHSPGTGQWLKKARRERLAERGRHGLAWVITLVIGGTVVIGSAYLLLGSVPGFEQILAFGQRTLQ
jgi:hypothetical protein